MKNVVISGVIVLFVPLVILNGSSSVWHGESGLSDYIPKAEQYCVVDNDCTVVSSSCYKLDCDLGIRRNNLDEYFDIKRGICPKEDRNIITHRECRTTPVCSEGLCKRKALTRPST